jgi:hypothetical protein
VSSIFVIQKYYRDKYFEIVNPSQPQLALTQHLLSPSSELISPEEWNKIWTMTPIRLQLFRALRNCTAVENVLDWMENFPQLVDDDVDAFGPVDICDLLRVSLKKRRTRWVCAIFKRWGACFSLPLLLRYARLAPYLTSCLTLSLSREECVALAQTWQTCAHYLYTPSTQAWMQKWAMATIADDRTRDSVDAQL